MGNERIRLTLVVALFAATLAGVFVASRYHSAHERGLPNWDAVPYVLEGWKGTDGRFDPVYGTDPADTSLLRIYTRADGAYVIAYVGFYSNLSEILDVHTPELCYPSQGWTILSSDKATAGVYRGEPIPASDIVVDKSGERRLVTWWYNGGSRPFENRIRYVYGMLVLSSLSGRTDGSMVRFETMVGPAGEAVARERVVGFEKNFLPVLDRALPR